MNGSKLTRAFDNDWIGPALVSLVAIAVISALQPSFLSSFNILVLLSAIAVNMLIALGQLVIIAVGQMNLALGSIGGLVAISFAAMMEIWHLPPLVAMGGAVTNLTAVSYAMAKYDPDKIQGTVLNRDEIDRQIALYRTTPLEQRRAIVGLHWRGRCPGPSSAPSRPRRTLR